MEAATEAPANGCHMSETTWTLHVREKDDRTCAGTTQPLSVTRSRSVSVPGVSLCADIFDSEGVNSQLKFNIAKKRHAEPHVVVSRFRSLFVRWVSA